MLLESLHELVLTLRERIDGHRAALSGNEMLTRYALIDPLLRELGWDTSDPATVTPEDTSGLGRGRPDYVLLADAQPVMVVEAKKLSSGLQGGANQAIQYAMDPNRQARYFAITDGQHWEIFDTTKPAYDMTVISFDLMAVSPAEVCLKTLALWRPSVAAGSVSAAEEPIVQPQDVPSSLPSELGSGYHSEPASNAPQTAPAPQYPSDMIADDKEWIPLSDLSVKQRGSPPVEIEFPDGNRIQIGRWYRVVTESVQWLQANGHLNSTNWRIRRSSRYIISDSPTHPTGKEFTAPRSVDHLYVEVNYSAVNLFKNVIIIIEHTGQDPSQFKVRLR